MNSSFPCDSSSVSTATLLMLESHSSGSQSRHDTYMRAGPFFLAVTLSHYGFKKLSQQGQFPWVFIRIHIWLHLLVQVCVAYRPLLLPCFERSASAPFCFHSQFLPVDFVFPRSLPLPCLWDHLDLLFPDLLHCRSNQHSRASPMHFLLPSLHSLLMPLSPSWTIAASLLLPRFFPCLPSDRG